MKLLVIGSDWPRSGHSVRAANIVVYELLCALAAAGRGEVGYLRIRRNGDEPLHGIAKTSASELRTAGVNVLNELVLDPAPGHRSAWRRLLIPRRTDFYPDSVFTSRVEQAIAEFAPDLILVPWSEWITALCADLPMVKFAYYGNPDHKAGTHRIRFEQRHGLSPYSPWRVAAYLKLLESQHLKVIMQYDMLGDVAANDADYYRSKGHPNAFYIQNVWIDRFGSEWATKRLHTELGDHPSKIIVNVGQLGGTANRYGLEILGMEVAPLLRAMNLRRPYELHILGMGDLIEPTRHALASPEIKIRGFVDDIDEEFFASDVFVCLNNASPFKVGHTRYLHAWSVGMCVVAHRDAALSMPEMRHGENCLLGGSSAEIAALIADAIGQRALRENLGKAGYETFKKHFTASVVAEKLWQHMQAALWARRGY